MIIQSFHYNTTKSDAIRNHFPFFILGKYYGPYFFCVPIHMVIPFGISLN